MTDPPAHRAVSRRFRFGAMTTALFLATTASCVLAAALADRYTVRFDVTATREHSLSQRTLNLLAGLREPIEIVLIADDRRLDRRARQRVGDVLDAFDHASPMLRVTRINPVTDAGRAQFTEVQARVLALYKSDIDAQRKAVAAAAQSAGQLADQLTGLSGAILSLKTPLTQTNDPLADQLDNLAAIARLRSKRLEPIAEEAQTAADDAPTNAEQIENAGTALAPELASLRDELTGLADAFARSLQSLPAGAGADASAALRGALSTTGAMRDRAARSTDALDRLGASEAALIQRLLKSTDTVLILAPGRSTAIPFASLFPARDRTDQAGPGAPEPRFAGEELISTAIASLDRPVTPIVVLTHNLPGRLLSSSGQASSPQANKAIGAMLDRLHLRGMGLAEWPIAIDRARPALARLNPDGDRPVVWLAFGTEGASAEAAGRFDQYAGAVNALLEDHQDLLVSVAPSTRPASGADDPIAQALAQLGVEADTGRPLIHRLQLAQGQAFEVSFTLHHSDSVQPIARAIEGLPTRLSWVTPIRQAPKSSATQAPILQVEPDPDTWAEAEWRGYGSAPDDRPWSSAASPTPNDSFDDTSGPWTVAAAVERIGVDAAAPTQRVVVVASPGWFFDRVTNQTAQIEGRQVTLYPGDMELLEASIYWLSHQDEMIAPSPRVAETPRIEPLSDAQLASIRWALILGLPSLTLLIGVVVRLTALR